VSLSQLWQTEKHIGKGQAPGSSSASSTLTELTLPPMTHRQSPLERGLHRDNLLTLLRGQLLRRGVSETEVASIDRRRVLGPIDRWTARIEIPRRQGGRGSRPSRRVASHDGAFDDAHRPPTYASTSHARDLRICDVLQDTV